MEIFTLAAHFDAATQHKLPVESLKNQLLGIKLNKNF
jgi:hypothetical protein